MLTLSICLEINLKHSYDKLSFNRMLARFFDSHEYPFSIFIYILYNSNIVRKCTLSYNSLVHTIATI